MKAVGSSPSDPDLATTVLFADDPLPAVATIKASHITRLRTAVNAVRGSTGLAAFAFTDATLTGAPVRAAHVKELRTALAASQSVLLLPAVAFGNQPLVAGVPIRRTHIEELRGGVR